MNQNLSTPYLNFLRRILIFSVILGLVAVLLYFLFPSRYFTPALPFLFILFIGITLTGYYFILRAAGKSFATFVNHYLLVTVLKLLLLIGVLFLYMLTNKPDAAAFAISFLLLYFLYMVFEVAALVRLFKSPGRKDSVNEK